MGQRLAKEDDEYDNAERDECEVGRLAPYALQGRQGERSQIVRQDEITDQHSSHAGDQDGPRRDVLGKALTHSPNSFAGGMPSGHAAVAFAGWVAASFIAVQGGAGSYAGLISVISLLMALLVCQSRVESGIHSVYQIIMGAVIGVLVTTAAFQLL